MADPFDLGRFVSAQARVYDVALSEMRAGEKRTHWMWFVFPQIKGLGHSPTARHYAIGSLDEARAYLAHSILGPRLNEAVVALENTRATSAQQIFGSVDAAKFRSSLTLFEAADGAPMFGVALERWFGGGRDDATLRLLAAPSR